MASSAFFLCRVYIKGWNHAVKIKLSSTEKLKINEQPFRNFYRLKLSLLSVKITHHGLV